MTKSKLYRQKRDLNRLGLNTFFMNIENNHYDIVANKLIKDLEKQITELKAQIESDIKEPGYMKYMQIYFLDKELFAISEMKILYAYKHFETHLKFLIKASYQEIKESEFYKWEIVEDFLKSKRIDPKEISDYAEMRDLRNLSNAIKHSRNILDNKTKNIIEFQNKTEIKYTDLILFYHRITNSSFNFLKALSDKIDKDIYEFDDDRLEQISEKLVTRMDNETINKLIEILEKKK